MKRYGLLILGTLAVCMAWAALVFATFSEGWLRSPLVEGDDPQAFVAAAKASAMADNRGNLAFVMFEDGREVGSFALSQGDPVDGDTLFQVASLGKWLTAWGVMALVEEGRCEPSDGGSLPPGGAVVTAQARASERGGRVSV